MNKTSNNVFPGRFAIYISIALLLVIGLNLVNIFIRLSYHALNGDEFQHTHIAWNIFQGLVPYKDFFEHHGALYGMINAAFSRLFSLEAGFSTIQFFRITSFFYMIGMLIAVFWLANLIFKSRLLALATVATLTSTGFFYYNIIMVRPDTLQSTFWFFGLGILILATQKRDLRGFLVSGLLVGLAIQLNFKVGAGLLGLLTYFLVKIYWDKNDSRRESIKSFLVFNSGILIPHLLMSIYFWFKGGLLQFHYYSIFFNFHSVAGKKTSITKGYISNFFDDHAALLALGIIGFVSVALLIRKSDYEQKTPFLILLFSTFGTSLGMAANFHSHYYLMLLPAYAIFLMMGIVQISKLRFINTGLRQSIFIVSALALMFYDLHPKDRLILQAVTDKNRMAQEELTNEVVKRTKREDPVAVIWNHYGGYSFNAPLQYYWAGAGNLAATIKKADGINMYGISPFVRNIVAKNVKYLIDCGTMKSVVPTGTYIFIKNNFRADPAICLWERKGY